MYVSVYLYARVYTYNFFFSFAEKLNLKMATEYKYLNQSDCLAIDGVDEAEKFHTLLVRTQFMLQQNLTWFFYDLSSSHFFFIISSRLPYNQKALDILRISKEDQERLFSITAAVLWLGNISFEAVDNGNQVEVLSDEGNPYLPSFC